MASSAEAQLCLNVTTPEATGEPVREIDLVDAVLAYHHGDHRAAIAELMADADFLRDQLFTASRLISHGITRGWKPKYERASGLKVKELVGRHGLP